MTQSELAFLALGLILGFATGGALVVVLYSRPPTHEIRVTVTRNAIPRRASTLAADALPGSPVGPAPGGPADHRPAVRVAASEAFDRTDVRSRPPIVAAPALPWLLTAFDQRSLAERAWADEADLDAAPPPPRGPTPVPIEVEPDPGAAPEPDAASRVAISIQPTADPLLAALGRATIVADAAAAAARDEPRPVERPEPASPGSTLPGLLAGDDEAIAHLVEAVAGADDAQRQAWDELVRRLVDAIRARSLDLGFVDLPMGNRFWDTFTVDECRDIVIALAAAGRQFDGQAGWADGIVPSYRDLSRACAEAGLDPRRVRAWPNSEEILDLYRGATIAAVEAIARSAPDLELADLRTFLASRDRELDELWLVWDAVRPALGLSTADAAELAGEVGAPEAVAAGDRRP